MSSDAEKGLKFYLVYDKIRRLNYVPPKRSYRQSSDHYILAITRRTRI
jgi:hypothetical protein